MKDKKNLLLLLPLLVFVGTFFLVKELNKQSYALNSDQPIGSTIPQNATFNYTNPTTSKNTYSHYIVSNNNGWASGTKKIKYNSDISVVVYCAENGKTITKKDHTRIALNNEKFTAVKSEKKTKLNKMMQYAYPYVSLGETSISTNSLKSYLRDEAIGVGEENYRSLDFDSLTAQEAITAVQASIWNIIEGTTKYKYGSYVAKLNKNSGTEKQFNSCSGYYGNGSKILTSEEEQWYQDDGCNSSGKFYKYVYKHSESTAAENRINALITWYISTLQEEGRVTDTSETFSLQGSPSFSDVTASTYTVTVTFKTNMIDYDISFKDVSGSELGNNVEITHSGNTYTLRNVPKTIKTIEVEAASNSVKKTVYWYRGSGQDFIGVDISNKTPFALEIVYEEQPGTAILYKVTGASKEVEVIDERRDNACGGDGQPTCLSGAKFALYYGNKNYLKQYITVEDGKFEVSNLAIGTYYLKEIDPPYGYDFYTYGVGAVDSNGYIEFTITDSKTVTIIVNNQPTNICIKKVSESDTNSVLSGATFVLEDIDGQQFGETFTSSNQVGAHCIQNLPVGSYYLTEVTAPVGFSIPARPYEFYVGKENSNTEQNDSTTLLPVTNGIITIKNKPGFTMSKSDVTDGACVEGATLNIKRSSSESGAWPSDCVEVPEPGEEGPVKQCLMLNDYVDISWKSTCSEGNDSHTVPICLNETERQEYKDQNIDCLLPDTYKLCETTSPKGYATTECTEFTVGSDGKITGDGNMKDAPIEVCIYKVKKGTKDVLVGAEYDIYDDEPSEITKEGTNTAVFDAQTYKCQVGQSFTMTINSNTCESSDSNIVEVKQGTEDGIVLNSVGRQIFTYTCKSEGTSTLTGYTAASLSQNGQSITATATVIVEKAKPMISMVSSEEPCVSYYFTPGKYTIKETKAPDGYKLPEDNETTIIVEDKAGKQEFYIENEVIAPKTSIDYSVTLIIIASVFMMFGIGFVGYYEYKKQH